MTTTTATINTTRTGSNKSLKELEQRGDFIRRHIGPDQHNINLMLSELNIDSLDDLVSRAVPPSILM
jgi:glycine dehydrogenase